MPRLIDMDALKEYLNEWSRKLHAGVYRNDAIIMEVLTSVYEYVSDMPTIDAEPVRHGRWIHTTREDNDWGGTFHRYTCSACNWQMGNNPTGWGIFCPACGAKMDLKEE